MRILIVGSGGREHAIAWKCAQSKRVDKIFCAPGNAGIGQIAECVPITAMEFDKLAAFAKEQKIDLTWMILLWEESSMHSRQKGSAYSDLERMRLSLRVQRHFQRIL